MNKIEQEKYSQQKLLTSLMRIKHAEKGPQREADRLVMMLDTYGVPGLNAVREEPDLYHHLTAYNFQTGKVWDSKVAMPIIGLRLSRHDGEFAENSVAHLCSLPPHKLYQAYQFNKVLVQHGHIIPFGNRRLLEAGLRKYLEVREADQGWWDSTAVSTRSALTGLYAVSHKQPSERAQAVLFDKKYPVDSIFAKIAELKTMHPKEAAGTILVYKIPFRVAIGAVPSALDKELWIALLETMSRNELVTNTGLMERIGVFADPILKLSYDKAMERTKKDKNVDALKASVAAERLEKSGASRKAVDALKKAKQEQVDRLQGVDGDVLILADRSGSMTKAIRLAQQIAAIVAAKINGQTHLVFFNAQAPRHFDATGRSLDEIEKITRSIIATGATSPGLGLDYAIQQGIFCNAIILVTDGGENTPPWFSSKYAEYTEKVGIEPTVTVFRLAGEGDYMCGEATNLSYMSRAYVSMPDAGILFDRFDLSKGDVDYYALPNLVSSISIQRYELLTRGLDTPLLTFADVFEEGNIVSTT